MWFRSPKADTQTRPKSGEKMAWRRVSWPARPARVDARRISGARRFRSRPDLWGGAPPALGPGARLHVRAGQLGQPAFRCAAGMSKVSAYVRTVFGRQAVYDYVIVG